MVEAAGGGAVLAVVGSGGGGDGVGGDDGAGHGRGRAEASRRRRRAAARPAAARPERTPSFGLPCRQQRKPSDRKFERTRRVAILLFGPVNSGRRPKAVAAEFGFGTLLEHLILNN